MNSAWWCMSLIPAMGRQRQVDLSEFEDSLVYKVSSHDSQGCYTVKGGKKKEKGGASLLLEYCIRRIMCSRAT